LRQSACGRWPQHRCPPTPVQGISSGSSYVRQ
jgi:hypothetical protein